MDTRLLANGGDPDITARWTREDLERFPDDGHRRELVDGHLLVSPLAHRRHQAVVTRFTVALHRWAEAHHGIVYPGVNVDLARDTHFEPDVVWTSDTDESGQGLPTTPEIVVEVGERVSPQRSEESPIASSPSTHRYDRGVKRERYLESGAREVWLVDLERDEVEVHRSVDAAPDVLRRGDTLTTSVLPGFAAAVDDLLGTA